VTSLRTYLTLQRHGPMTATQLAHKLGQTPNHVTNTLTRLHRHGYVTPIHNPDPFYDQPGPKPRLWRCTETTHGPK